MSLTQEKLKLWMHYDPETGAFTRLRAGKRSDRVGESPGCLQHQGYLLISVDSERYKAHRLAWLYMTGHWPLNIDHRNGLKADNRFSNLREATKAQNEMNKPLRASNASGKTGVYWSRAAQKWQAYIVSEGKFRYLGIYADKASAVAARTEAEIALFGEFAYVAVQ